MPSHHHHPHARPHGDTAKGAGARERRALLIAVVLTIGYALVESVGGWLAGSLALFADAGHMVTDAAALGIALLAQHVARLPPSRRASYGYARAEVIGAFINALLMLAVVVGISVEAVRRLLAPSPVAGGMVMVIAAIGLLINIFAAWSLSQGQSLNSRAALLHVSGDMLGSVAAIVAGAVVASTGWMPIDPILSLLVAALVLRSTWLLLKASTHVLMEGVPANLSYDEIGRALTRVPGVAAVHDLHVWQMTTDRTAMSAHLLIREAQAWPQILAAAQRLLAERYRIDHVTLQPAWHPPPADKRVIPLTPIAGDDKPHLH
ncbi:MAG: cation diffusion facilitator family transporter [Betaproteobacteria bacterium]